MKYILFSIEDISNGGDEILRVTSNYLIHLTDNSAQCEQVQIKPKRKHLQWHYLIEYYLGNAVKLLSTYVNGELEFKLRNISYTIQYWRYFRNKIKSADKIVLPIGMLKYSTQHMSYLFYLINNLCSRYNKPVMMSAMSIEVPDYKDWRFHQLINAVNTPSVKMITTRDGAEGLQRLRKYYVKRQIYTDFVGDPALWVPETYNISKNIDSRGKIGINLIRPNIYNSYKKGTFSENQLIDFYIELVKELEKRNYEWEMFCNGMTVDLSLGYKVLDALNISHDKIAPVPSTGEELSSLISKYKAVVGARLHACITSVSLGVPVVGLLWDDKLEFFSKTMGIREFFSLTNELTGKNVVDKIEKSIAHKFDFDNRDFYKQKTLDSFTKFTKEDYE